MATASEAYTKHEDEKATSIIPYKMRRMFKMRDPYPVLVARNWARDMAAIECLLFIGCLIVLATMGFTNQDATVAEKDDDSINVLGVDITGQIGLKEEYSRAQSLLLPFMYKGLLMFVEILAVMCACMGACMASCCHFKFLALDEISIMRTLGYCTGASVLATAMGIFFTTITLMPKWKRALADDDTTESGVRGSLLVMSMYGFFAAVLLCLRLSTTLKARRASTALREEVLAV